MAGTLGEDLLLTVQSSKLSEYAKPDHDLNTISDLFAALRSCWQPPDGDHAAIGMQMTVRLSFKRDGEMFGQPRLTYATPGARRIRAKPTGMRSMRRSRAAHR